MHIRHVIWIPTGNCTSDLRSFRWRDKVRTQIHAMSSALPSSRQCFKSSGTPPISLSDASCKTNKSIFYHSMAININTFPNIPATAPAVPAFKLHKTHQTCRRKRWHMAVPAFHITTKICGIRNSESSISNISPVVSRCNDEPCSSLGSSRCLFDGWVHLYRLPFCR